MLSPRTTRQYAVDPESSKSSRYCSVMVLRADCHLHTLSAMEWFGCNRRLNLRFQPVDFPQVQFTVELLSVEHLNPTLNRFHFLLERMHKRY